MFKKEDKILVKLVFLKEVNESESVAPSFAQPEAKTNQVRLLSEFRNLKRQLKRKTYPIPGIREILLNLEDY